MVSADGKELTIYSMDIELEGEYSCVGMLKDDENEKQELKTNVTLIGLGKFPFLKD